MIISPFRTQLTRMIQNGEKSPTRSAVNRKALEKELRKAVRQARIAREAKKAVPASAGGE